MVMKTNNDGSVDHDRDDRDNRDDQDDNDATDRNDDDNIDADDGNSDDIENINDDNGYKCAHARLYIHARAPAHSHTGTIARLHTH